MPATRTSSCRAPLIEFPDLLTAHYCLVREVSNECHNGVVVLDLPVDALVDELVAGVCKRLALVPVSNIKPDHIGVVGENLVCHPMEIMLGFDHRSARKCSVFLHSAFATVLIHASFCLSGFEMVNQNIVIEIQLLQRIDVVFADCSICLDAGQRSLAPRIEVQQMDWLSHEWIVCNR